MQRERIQGVYDAMSAAGLDPESLTVVESYEDRCSGLHVDCSAREPLAGRAWWCPRELAGRTPYTEGRPTRREVPG